MLHLFVLLQLLDPVRVPAHSGGAARTGAPTGRHSAGVGR